MKLMKIFGMVFALHVALACIVVGIQGCRSSTTPSQPNSTAATVPAPAPDNPNWSTQAAAMNAPVVEDSYYTPSAPADSAPLLGLSPAERARTEPTRPLNPNEYISVSGPETTLVAPPPEPASYVVRSGDSYWRIAKANNTTIAELQRLNPGVKPDALRPGMTIKVPGTASALTPSPVAPVSPGSGVTSAAASSTYIVRPGDSLSKIAARNGTTVAALRAANTLRNDIIQVGQSLMIPGGTGTSAPVSYDVAPLTPPGASADEVTFVVQRGDTLGEIARKFDVTVSDLMAANNITDPRKLRLGQKLVIPGFRAVGTGAIPRPASETRPATPPANQPLLPPPGTTPNPPANETPPPANGRPAEFDAPPVDLAAPPVQLLDDPVPAP